MYPHRIRLRGPWEVEPLAVAGGMDQTLPAPCRMTMPCRWSQGGLAGFAGRVRFVRRFGFPGRIDAHERVWLTFAGADSVAEVWLNGRFLGRQEQASGPFEFEVTALLTARNTLVVEVEGSADTGGLGEVALEVRCTAYLRELWVYADTVGATPRLHVDGEIVGFCERPLELYVLLDGSTVAYRLLEPVPAGRPFHVVSEQLGPERCRPRAPGDPPHVVRVDLVNGATIWYTFEQAFTFS